jgi:catechol 2,3-dioxygenase-like lactoylglutathione lyase family enzyme
VSGRHGDLDAWWTYPGINHIALLTSDLDRLAGFYEELFGARKVLELPIPEPEGPGRHALIAVGAGATLHVFEFANIPPPPERPMLQRGRIDHFALNVPTPKHLKSCALPWWRLGAAMA